MTTTPSPTLSSVKDLKGYDPYPIPMGETCASMVSLALNRYPLGPPSLDDIAQVLGTTSDVALALVKGVLFVQQATDGVFVPLPDAMFPQTLNLIRHNFLRLCQAAVAGAKFPSDPQTDTSAGAADDSAAPAPGVVCEMVETCADNGYTKPERKQSTYKPIGDEVVHEADGSVTFVSANGVARTSR